MGSSRTPRLSRVTGCTLIIVRSSGNSGHPIIAAGLRTARPDIRRTVGLSGPHDALEVVRIEERVARDEAEERPEEPARLFRIVAQGLSQGDRLRRWRQKLSRSQVVLVGPHGGGVAPLFVAWHRS